MHKDFIYDLEFVDAIDEHNRLISILEEDNLIEEINTLAMLVGISKVNPDYDHRKRDLANAIEKAKQRGIEISVPLC